MKAIGGDLLNPTLDHPELRRFDPAGNRRSILQLYLLLRALFAGASFVGLAVLTQGWLEFPGLKADAAPKLWQAWGVFFSWSIVLAVAWFIANRSQKLSRADRLILVSILPDTFALFLATSVTGGTGSPLYHSLYFLIAIHSYHLAVPGAEGAVHTRFSLGMRYVLTSILPSFVAAVVLFLASRARHRSAIYARTSRSVSSSPPQPLSRGSAGATIYGTRSSPRARTISSTSTPISRGAKRLSLSRGDVPTSPNGSRTACSKP